MSAQSKISPARCEHYFRLNVLHGKGALLHGCVVTQLGDGISDAQEAPSAHEQMEKPLTTVKLQPDSSVPYEQTEKN